MTGISFLLVDDDVDFHPVFEPVLEQALPRSRIVLDRAVSLDGAMAALREKPYSLTFVNYRVGAETGVELIRRCALERIRLSAVILSDDGAGSEEAETEALAYGAFEFLDRTNITPKGLSRVIHSAWNTATRREELRNALRQVQESAAAKSLFLSNMSHELRTPLNGVLGFAEMLQLDLIATDPDKVKEYAANIIVSGQRLMDLIVELLTLRRVQGDRFQTSRPIAGTDFFRTLCRRHETQARARNVAFNLNLPDQDFVMHTDVDTLRLAFRPILDNAVKFTDSGKSVEVIIAPETTGVLSVTIRDEGIGMNKQTVEMASHPFYQHDASFARRFEGAGIGLTVAENAVSVLEGTFEITSEIGMGTTVTVRLPVLANTEENDDRGKPDENVGSLIA
ncbi:hypothetical protein HH303_03140 [Rhodospirillaceae bacterium KN72]|uniref:histidine kinase n=1 Tax=Pacificispira spongiicola TaxID=2729598 RepID=A0A7Y0DXV4_9PROT|nr:ATP-binding protein [Pacificispira spongiicola]NMM43458.1 hypothetical protein [Pacificispira spongiicola]